MPMEHGHVTTRSATGMSIAREGSRCHHQAKALPARSSTATTYPRARREMKRACAGTGAPPAGGEAGDEAGLRGDGRVAGGAAEEVGEGRIGEGGVSGDGRGARARVAGAREHGLSDGDGDVFGLAGDPRVGEARARLQERRVDGD